MLDMSQTDKPLSNQEEQPVMEDNDKQVIHTAETVESGMLVCPECGATTTSDGRPFTEGGLKAHRLRSHRKSPHGKKKKVKTPEVAPVIPGLAIKPAVKPAISTEEVKVQFSPETQEYIADMVEQITVKTLETRLGAIAKRQQQYGYRGYRPYQQRNEEMGPLTDMEMAETLRARRKQEAELHEIEMQRKAGHNPGAQNNPVITNLQQTVTHLQEELEKEREQRKEDRMKGIETSISDLRTEIKDVGSNINNKFGLWNTAVKETADLLKYDMRARFRLENPEEHIEREKVPTPEGEPTLAEKVKMMNPDLVEGD